MIYRWYCQSESRFTWLDGTTVMSVLTNMVIVLFPGIVIVGGFRSQASLHANTDGSRGALMATDFVRAALVHGVFAFLADQLFAQLRQHA